MGSKTITGSKTTRSGKTKVKSFAKLRRSSSSKLSKIISDASYGWLGTAADLGLVTLYLGVASVGARPSNVNKIIGGAGQLLSFLQTKRLQSSLKNSLHYLAASDWYSEGKISSAGFKRLKQLVPTYHKKRDWNGWLFLVIYDISENLHRSREKLRIRMKEIKMGMMQESVWVSLTDPEPFLKDVVEWNELEECVLTLKTHPTGPARKNLVPILSDAFNLTKLNLLYRSFIDEVMLGKKSTEELAIRYMKILKEDPQLPFKLLSKDWLGDKAHRIYLEKVLPQMPHEYGEFIEKLERI